MALDLHESTLRLSVAVTAYLIALAILIPVSGWVADRYGARRVYCASIGVFMAGSLGCGFAQSIGALVLWRFVQGMGGSMMGPVGRLILTRGVEKRSLVPVMNYMMLPGILGPSAGPVIGGFITTYASWRWNFFINVPIGLIGLIAAARVIPATAPQPQARFDWSGFLLVGAGAAALQGLLEAVGRPFLPGPALIGLALLVVLCAGLYALHARGRAAPLIDPALFRIRTFAVAVLAGNVARAGLFSVQFLLPALLQLEFGYSAFHAGLLTFLVSAGAFLVRPFSALTLRRFGFRRTLAWSTLGAAAMLAGFAQLRPATPVWFAAAYILLFGTLRSSIFSGAGALAFADIERAGMAASNAVAQFTQRLCTSFGISFGAGALALSASGQALSRGDFAHAFLGTALLTSTALIGVLRLRDADGWQVSGYGGDANPKRRPM